MWPIWNPLPTRPVLTGPVATAWALCLSLLTSLRDYTALLLPPSLLFFPPSPTVSAPPLRGCFTLFLCFSGPPQYVCPCICHTESQTFGSCPLVSSQSVTFCLSAPLISWDSPPSRFHSLDGAAALGPLLGWCWVSPLPCPSPRVPPAQLPAPHAVPWTISTQLLPCFPGKGAGPLIFHMNSHGRGRAAGQVGPSPCQEDAWEHRRTSAPAATGHLLVLLGLRVELPRCLLFPGLP